MPDEPVPALDLDAAWKSPTLPVCASACVSRWMARARHAVDQVAQQPLRILPLGHVVDVMQVAAQLVASRPGDIEAGVGDRQRRRHARDPAADDQRARTGCAFPCGRRASAPRAPPPSVPVPSPCGRLFRLVDVNPGALLAQVDHFQVRIQPGFADDALKQRFVRAVAAAGHDQAIAVPSAIAFLM